MLVKLILCTSKTKNHHQEEIFLVVVGAKSKSTFLTKSQISIPNTIQFYKYQTHCRFWTSYGEDQTILSLLVWKKDKNKEEYLKCLKVCKLNQMWIKKYKKLRKWKLLPKLISIIIFSPMEMIHLSFDIWLFVLREKLILHKKVKIIFRTDTWIWIHSSTVFSVKDRNIDAFG